MSFLAAGKNTDNIIPLFIKYAMPPWFTPLFMITLLAAAMSTLSSQFHTMGSTIGRDVYEKGFDNKGGNTVLITRIGMIISIVIALIIAWFLPKFLEKGSAIIAIGTAIFFALCAAAFLPMYFGALYSKSITKTAAISGFLTGTIVSFFWLIFVHSKESAPLKLCKFIFGTETLAGTSNWQYVDALIIALPASIIVTIVVSFFTKEADKNHLKKCFDGIGKQ
jgi:SSS family solute:Na+ symporter